MGIKPTSVIVVLSLICFLTLEKLIGTMEFWSNLMVTRVQTSQVGNYSWLSEPTISNNARVTPSLSPNTKKTPHCASWSFKVWNSETMNEIVECLRNGQYLSSQTILVGDENRINGTIEGSGRLVVPVDASFAFWFGGQKRLCQLLRDMTFRESLDYDSAKDVIRDLLFLPRPLLNLTLDCQSLGQSTGNWIIALYCVRMAAAVARVDYQFQCSNDDVDSRRSLALTWFAGFYKAPMDSIWPFDGVTAPTEAEACPNGAEELRIDRLSHEIQRDVQKMVVSLVGFPSFIHKKAYAVESTTVAPLFPDVRLDDVAIHFRCGDVMGTVDRLDYGIIHFSEYVKWIHSDTKSIGILTQPFDVDRNREVDRESINACREATYLLVSFLQQHYPHANINVHNGPDETIPLVYARLASARQSFTSLSTFGIFPVIGTFGDGYFFRGENPEMNPFAPFVTKYIHNLHEIQATYLSSWQIKNMGLNATLKWLVGHE